MSGSPRSASSAPGSSSRRRSGGRRRGRAAAANDDNDAPAAAVVNDEAEEVDEREEDLDGTGAPEDEGEGDDLIAEGMENDYRAIPALDNYDLKDLDQDEHEEVTFEQRRAAERANRKREAETARRQGRTPAALLDGSGDDEEELPERRKQRRIDDGGDGGGGGPPDDDDDGGFVALEDFKGQLKEWLQLEQPRREVRKRFRTFLTDFKDGNTLVYSQVIKLMCEQNRQSLEISYAHLAQGVPVLAIWVADEPEQMLGLLNEVAVDVVRSTFPHYQHVHAEIYVRITNLPIVDKIRDLRQLHLNALVKAEGVVTRRSSVFPQLKLVRYTCGKCRALSMPYQQTDREVTPKMCIECQSKGPFILNSAETIYSNYQKITLQESPGSVPAGRIPRQKEVILLHDLIDRVTVGSEVEVTGVYKHTYDPSLNWSNGFPVFSTIIQANYISTKQDVVESFHLTDDDKKEIRKLSTDPNIATRIINSIAPSIYGHIQVKTALALVLFGGEPKEFENKHRIRGDINLLVLGDPGTAKSQLLKYAQKMADRSVYTTGKGASAVGLTASVHVDPLTREWTLEGGALVLADKGVCMIDEFDKMSDQDRTSIHEAMEQQSISISKAGIITSLKARCAVVAAANPINGRYDSSATFADNVTLTDPILSRFDILCVIRDEVDRSNDRRLAEFVIQSHRAAHPNYDEKTDGPAPGTDQHRSDSKEAKTESKSGLRGLGEDGKDGDEKDDDSGYDHDTDKVPQALLKKYIAYARQHIHPKLARIDDDKIAKLYADLRRESIKTGGIPIAVRHVESIVRMSEAHAKMHLRDHVNDDDVDLAISVMLDSFIGSQKFSVRRALAKHFGSYITKKQDKFELIMFIIDGLVKNERMLRNASRVPKKRTAAASPDDDDDGELELSVEDPIEIPTSEIEAKAAEVNILNLVPFYKSKAFARRGLKHDARRKMVVVT